MSRDAAPGHEPDFAVVVPTRDRASLVCEAVASALAQTYPPAEIIVVDDGSTDDTCERLAAAFADARVRVVRSAHRGASAARNLGVQRARSRFIAFLDSDDLFEPGKLEAFRAAIARAPDAVLYHSGWKEVDQRTGATRLLRPSASGDARHALLMFTPIATPAVVCRRRDFLAAGGFREGQFLAEDYDLWCRLSAAGPVDLLAQPLTTVRLHDGNSYRDPEQVLRNQLEVVARFFETCPTEGLRERRCYEANVVYAVGVLNFVQGDHERAREHFFQALRRDPRHNIRRCVSMIARSTAVLLGCGRGGRAGRASRR